MLVAQPLDPRRQPRTVGHHLVEKTVGRLDLGDVRVEGVAHVGERRPQRIRPRRIARRTCGCDLERGRRMFQLDATLTRRVQDLRFLGTVVLRTRTNTRIAHHITPDSIDAPTVRRGDDLRGHAAAADSGVPIGHP